MSSPNGVNLNYLNDYSNFLMYGQVSTFTQYNVMDSLSAVLYVGHD